MAVDPRTPVVVGVGPVHRAHRRRRIPGHVRSRPGDRGRRAPRWPTPAPTSARWPRPSRCSPGLRQFEICTPFAKPPLGCSDNYLRSVANRVGADPARAVLEPIGGNGPQKLMTEFAGAIAAGDIEVALILGSEPGSTAKYFAGPRRQAGLHRARRWPARGPRLRFRAVHERVHREARADRSARAVRAARQRPPSTARTQRRRLPARDGRAVRPVLRSRCQEPVLVLTGGTVGARRSKPSPTRTG